MADDPHDAYKMPKRLEVVDLEGKPSLPPLPAGAAASVGVLSALDLEDANIELEPQAARPVQRTPLAKPPRRPIPWSWIGGVLLCCGLAIAGYRYLQAHKREVEVELLDAPENAKLVLDGAPIESLIQRLPRSTETHRVTVFATGRAPKTVTFTANEDTSVELGP